MTVLGKVGPLPGDAMSRDGDIQWDSDSNNDFCTAYCIKKFGTKFGSDVELLRN